MNFEILFTIAILAICVANAKAQNKIKPLDFSGEASMIETSDSTQTIWGKDLKAIAYGVDTVVADTFYISPQKIVAGGNARYTKKEGLRLSSNKLELKFPADKK